MVKIHFIVICIAIIFAAACNREVQSSEQIGSMVFLSKNLGETFSKREEGNTYELKYCPDNTCLIFRGAINQKAELADFALLYLGFASSYVYLANDLHGYGVFLDKIDVISGKLIGKYKDGCSGGEYDVVSCTFRNLQRIGDVSVSFSRLDEGETHIQQLNLDNETSSKKLAGVSKRRKDWRD